MKILFLSHRLPFPPNKGDKIRSHALFTHLAAKHQVYLGCFIDDEADFPYCQTVREMAGGDCRMIPLPKRRKLLGCAQAMLNGESITAEVYRSAEMQAWVDDILQTEQIDCAVVFSSSMAPYLLAGKYLAPERVLFDMVDLDSDKWLQYSRTAGAATAWIYRREARKLLELERQAAAKFALTYLVSDHEVQSFAQLAPESIDRIKAFCNGVNLEYFAPGPYASPFPANVTPIVMTGHMEYWPNVEGAIWFSREVLPLVKRQIPDARFYVVGSAPTPALRAIAAPDVEVTGEVPDVRPYVAAAKVVVAPLRIARGVQNKVLEALAMGVPTVATEEASRALTVASGHDILVANNAVEFAEAVVKAAGTAGREAIAANGRSYVERNHDWNRLLGAFDAALQDLSAWRGARNPRHLSGRSI
jgi:sugar transferase (PEP-CTERM/EpsH1 system associated)